MNRSILAAAALASSLLAVSAGAAPLRPDHPLVGTWTIVVPGTRCTETLTILPSGLSPVTSGEEVSESVVEISDTAAANGFYKWVDRVTKTNGRKDCAGEVTPVGDVATNYIRMLDASGTRFAVCTDETARQCFGPYVRQGTGGH